MLKEPHHPQLSEHSLAAHQALKDIRQFLEGDPLAVPGVCHAPDHSEGSVANGSVGLEV